MKVEIGGALSCVEGGGCRYGTYFSVFPSFHYLEKYID